MNAPMTPTLVHVVKGTVPNNLPLRSNRQSSLVYEILAKNYCYIYIFRTGDVTYIHTDSLFVSCARYNTDALTFEE